MEKMKIEVISKSKEILWKDMDHVIACSIAELDFLSYSMEVLKAVAVLLRSKITKTIKNSSYYSSEEELFRMDEDAFEGLAPEGVSRIRKAIEETNGIVAVSGEETVGFYCTTCCEGGTANSEDIIGYRLSYLRKVLCRHCGECQGEKTLGINEIKEKVEGKGTVYKDEIDGILKNIKRDETGRILEINVLGRVMTGSEFMELFGLKSNRVFFAEESIRLKVQGEGLGLGICLKGADSLASQGADFKEIISYYYTGVEFKSINENNIQKCLKERVFVIDAGHGGKDFGNINNSVIEKDVNLSISNCLKGLLEEMGAEVIMTRAADEDISLGERVKHINSVRPNFFISLHQNSFASPGVNGAEAYCFTGDQESAKLGKLILESINKSLGIKNRGVKFGDYYLLRETRVVGVLLETMYITGNTDSEKYSEENYKNIAKAIFEAICLYYNIEP